MPVIPKEGQKPGAGNALNPSRKFSLRLSLATGATLATLVGAQTLALMDDSKPAPPSKPPILVDGQITAQPVTRTPDATLTLPNAAPHIVIVRNAGTPAAKRPAIARPVAQPPQNAAQPPPAANPPPVNVVPAPIQPQPPSHSSR